MQPQDNCDLSAEVNFRAQEEQVLKRWREQTLLSAHQVLRRQAPRFVVHYRPRQASHRPDMAALVVSVLQDAIPRFRALKGDRVHTLVGWHVHGLPIEIQVEHELGLAGKKDVETYGVERFNQHCHEVALRYVQAWQEMRERAGCWEAQAEYVLPLDSQYVESVWQLIRQLWDRDLIYQGYKVVPYCPRCGTPLSHQEAALGQRSVSTSQVYVRFPIQDEPGAYFLACTTAPWTLTGNVALAVNPSATYALVRQGDEKLVLAQALLDRVLGTEVEVLTTMQGRDLVGMRYQPIFRFLPVVGDYGYLIEADFVSAEDGTGIAHVAPAFATQDLEVARLYDLPILMTVDAEGRFVEEVQPWRGLFVRHADPLIIEELENRGLVYRVETIEAEMPFCCYCGTPLLTCAKTAWYVETGRFASQSAAHARDIRWLPACPPDFERWVTEGGDWLLSRERYWGTPLPIWECDTCGAQECMGGVTQLINRLGLDRHLTGVDVRDLLEEQGDWTLDLHRPYVDDATWTCPECEEGTVRRVPDVVDARFELALMLYAGLREAAASQGQEPPPVPVDLVCAPAAEAADWLYGLHSVATLLSDAPAFRACLLLGPAGGGEEIPGRAAGSNPQELLALQGADALRWYAFTSAEAWEKLQVVPGKVEGVVQRFMRQLQDAYAFLATHARTLGWRPVQGGIDQEVPASTHPLDRWLISELQLLLERVDTALSQYDVGRAAQAIDGFVEDFSDWYMRRTRRRFGEGRDRGDQEAACATLHHCLLALCRMLAPFTPFLSETLYQELTQAFGLEAPESVHLSHLPEPNPSLIDHQLMNSMRLGMRLARLGRSARERAGIEIHQPLPELVVGLRDAVEKEALRWLADDLQDELNVRRVRPVHPGEVLVNYRVTPKPAVLGPKHGERFPALRAALAALDANAVARQLLAGIPLALTVEGETVEILPDEVWVEPTDREGYVVVEEGGYLVALSTHIPDVLRAESLAREIIERIQALRHEAGIEPEAQITVYLQADPALMTSLKPLADTICRETSAVTLEEAPPPADAQVIQVDLEGATLTLGIRRVDDTP